MSLEPISKGLSEQPRTPVPGGGDVKVPSYEKRERVSSLERSQPNPVFEQVVCEFQ